MSTSKPDPICGCSRAVIAGGQAPDATLVGFAAAAVDMAAIVVLEPFIVPPPAILAVVVVVVPLLAIAVVVVLLYASSRCRTFSSGVCVTTTEATPPSWRTA